VAYGSPCRIRLRSACRDDLYIPAPGILRRAGLGSDPVARDSGGIPALAEPKHAIASPPAVLHWAAGGEEGDVEAGGRTPGVPVAPATHRLEHMSDLTPVERLAKLRALEQWLDWQLRDTRRRIEAAEAQARAVTGYITEPERKAGQPVGVTIHTADCTRIQQAAATLDATKAQYALLKDSGFNHPCVHCRPDRALGIVKE